VSVEDRLRAAEVSVEDRLRAAIEASAALMALAMVGDQPIYCPRCGVPKQGTATVETKTYPGPACICHQERR
jgi:hypothetical protein